MVIQHSTGRARSLRSHCYHPPTEEGEIRVCHVIHSLQRGGAEHLLVDLAHSAPAAGIELAIVSLMRVPPQSYEKELIDLGVPVNALGLGTRWDPRGLSRGLRAIREAAPDVIHTHLKHADIVGAFSAGVLGLPMVSTLHLIEETPTSIGRLKRGMAARARLRAARRTITVSDSQRRWYLKTFRADPSRVVTVRNGVRPPEPVPASHCAKVRAALGVPPKSVMATMVAVMRPGKGHADLLAAARCITDPVDVTFVLAGDGPLRTELESAANAAPPGSARVVFAGFREDVAELLAASDLVVHPSLADALPTALIHALAAGRPIIASAVGGIPEIVTPEAGLLVPPADPPALASAVIRLSRDSDERERLGNGARRRFAEEFEAALWVDRLRLVYSSVLEGER